MTTDEWAWAQRISLLGLEHKVETLAAELQGTRHQLSVQSHQLATLMNDHYDLVRGQIGTAVRIAVSRISDVSTEAPHATDLKQIQGLARDAANLARVREVVRNAGIGDVEHDLLILIREISGAPRRVSSAHPPVKDEDIDGVLSTMPNGPERDKIASAATVLRQLRALAADVGVDLSKYK